MLLVRTALGLVVVVVVPYMPSPAQGSPLRVGLAEDIRPVLFFCSLTMLPIGSWASAGAAIWRGWRS